MFESELRSALFVSSGQNIVERAQGSGPAAWQAWLRQHQLRQLIRCDKETDLVRLDGTQHLPAISQAPFFRARAFENGLAVDLWLEDEGGVTEFAM